ncbi:MAG: alpha-glucosidase [Lachnospiraceae bacterium]|nr:alpha-glucosidase [Lachnospiraceae bacterium]
MILNDFKDLELAVAKGENSFTMSRGSFSYKQDIHGRKKLKLVSKKEDLDNIRFKFEDGHEIEVREKDGRVTLDYVGDPGSANRFWITFAADPKEHIYGCGETYSKFDLKGEKVRVWVAEHQNVGRISKKVIKRATIGRITGPQPDRTGRFSSYESYYAQPTFTSSKKFYMHVYTNAYSEFDFTRPDRTTLYLQEPPHLVTESGKTFAEVSEKLKKTVSTVHSWAQPMREQPLPDWIYDGAILAVQEGTQRVDEKIQMAVNAGGKICGIWSQDWSGCRRTGFGYQVMWNWITDRDLYPGLTEQIEKWRDQGIRFLGYINPFLAIEKEIYREASEKGYCVKNKEGEDYLVTITTFPAAMIDFTNPQAYDWYKELIKKNMIGIGMGGWMADFGEYLPVDAVLYSGEDPYVIHNQWPAIWARLNREAIVESGKEGEVFFFTRAGHTGTIDASTMMWTGDQHVDWSVDDGLISVVPATLSLAMSGYGITHSDAGGYTTYGKLLSRSKELLMRWMEMDVFTPLLRTHEGNQPVNDVQWYDDKELLEHTAKCSRMHAALKPYLMRLAAETQDHGTPVMRPIFYHYNETNVYTEKTEYLLGPDVLVAPVYRDKAQGRRVYFPSDTWVNIFTGTEYTGGFAEVDAPIGQPPVFVRRGSNMFEELMAVAKA